MHAVSFGFLFFFVYNNLIADFFSHYTIGIYAFVGGKIQDSIMVNALGKDAPLDNIIRHSFKANDNVSKVKEVVMSKQFRKLFALERKEQFENETLKLRTPKKDDWQLILEAKETENHKETILKRARYQLRR